MELEKRHKKFIGPKKAKIVDSEEEEVFRWIQRLNPQSGKDFMQARAAAATAVDAYGTNSDDEKAAEVVAKASLCKCQKREFSK